MNKPLNKPLNAYMSTRELASAPSRNLRNFLRSDRSERLSEEERDQLLGVLRARRDRANRARVAAMNRGKEQATRNEWHHEIAEIAMEAGMSFGCDGFNNAMGYC